MNTMQEQIKAALNTIKKLEQFMEDNRMKLASTPIEQEDGTVIAFARDGDDLWKVVYKDDHWNFADFK